MSPPKHWSKFVVSDEKSGMYQEEIEGSFGAKEGESKAILLRVAVFDRSKIEL